VPLLAVHGSGGGHDQGTAFAGGLVSRGIRVIAMSRLGCLRTPMPADASAVAQADAHGCLLDAQGIPKAAVAGGSAGAPSALHPARDQVIEVAMATPPELLVRGSPKERARVEAMLASILPVTLRADGLHSELAVGRKLLPAPLGWARRRGACSHRRTALAVNAARTKPMNAAV